MDPNGSDEAKQPGTGKRVCVVGASGKLGRYLVQHALDRGYEVVGVCRERSVPKLAEFTGRITVLPGPTDDRAVIARAVNGCDAVLTVLVPWGVNHYASGTAQAVLDHARPGARLVFSCGWHVARDGKDVYTWKFTLAVAVLGRLAKLARVVDVDDQVKACRRIFASDTKWTVARGSDLEESDSQGLPNHSLHAGWSSARVLLDQVGAAHPGGPREVTAVAPGGEASSSSSRACSCGGRRTRPMRFRRSFSRNSSMLSPQTRAACCSSSGGRSSGSSWASRSRCSRVRNCQWVALRSCISWNSATFSPHTAAACSSRPGSHTSRPAASICSCSAV